MHSSIPGGREAALFLTHQTEQASASETSQRRNLAGELRCVGLRCLRCGHHGAQVWWLPIGDVASCFKCGCELVADSTVKVPRSVSFLPEGDAFA